MPTLGIQHNLHMRAAVFGQNNCWVEQGLDTGMQAEQMQTQTPCGSLRGFTKDEKA